MVKYPHNTSKGGTTMPQIPKEAQQAIEKQARSILNKYGEGSIYQKPGKKDQLQFLYDDETGTKRRKALSIPEGADPQQVKLEFIIKTLTNRYQLQQEQKKRQLLQETISQDFLEKVDKIVEALPETKKTLNPCTKTVSQVVDEYLVNAKSRNIAYSTYIGYCSYAGKIKQGMGTKLIKDVTKIDLETTLNNARNDKNQELLSKSYIRATRTFFTQVLKFAKKKKYIMSYDEITTDVEMPLNLKKSSSEDLFLDYNELGKVLFCLRDYFRFFVILRILVITGLRGQELFALKKQDIDRTNQCLHIRQALKKQEKTTTDPNDRRYKIGNTKTESSSRLVPATDTVFKLLDEWLEYTKEKGIQKKAIEMGNGELIFTDENGRVLDKEYIRLILWRYEKKFPEMPHVSFHMMRHCFATFLDRENCPLRLIQQALGHSTTNGSVTEIHYIAPNPNYISRIMPYVQKVDDKIDRAYNVYETAYIRTIIKKGEQ